MMKVLRGVRGGQSADRPTTGGMLGAGDPRRSSPQSRPPVRVRSLAFPGRGLIFSTLSIVPTRIDLRAPVNRSLST